MPILTHAPVRIGILTHERISQIGRQPFAPGTKYTFAPMSDTFDPYRVPHWPSWAAIGKGPRTLSLIVHEMPATKTQLPAT